MPVRVAHRTTGIFLRAAGRPAGHLGYQIFEARWRHTMMRFINAWIGVQSRIAHDPIYQVVHDSRDVIHAAQPIVERWFFDRWLFLHQRPPPISTNVASA